MGGLQLTSVVNEGNVEGIEMHERYSDFESLVVLILNVYQFIFHEPHSVSQADIKYKCLYSKNYSYYLAPTCCRDHRSHIRLSEGLNSDLYEEDSISVFSWELGK